MTDHFAISYGQNAEDVVLHRALSDVDTGFYVEVGANHPTELSISRAFYDAGWRGLEIEPVDQLADAFAAARPRDHVVRAAITNADVDEVTLHVIPGTGLSTLDDDISSEHVSHGYDAREVSVPARRLADLLDDVDPPGGVIHFMVVDTEGTEAAVLASNDWTRWRPWVLVVEATRPLSTQPTHQVWEPALIAHGYEFCLFDGISRFYVAAEHADRLRERLSAPANVLDGYTPHHWHRRELEFAGVRAELDDLRRVQAATTDELVRWRGLALGRWAEAVTGGGPAAGVAGHEAARLRAELDATRSTLSWRVTAPLRMVQERRLRGRS